jgi:adhesin/invasin
MTAAPTGASRTYDVHRVTRNWVEAQATWDEADSNLGIAWTTPGGDFVATPTASTTTGTVSGVWLSWDVTADVSAWYNGTASNYGILIKDNTESSATNYEAQLATRENATTANRPKLVVAYIPPDLQITSMTVDPSVVSGDTVTVTMTVTNNGPVAVSDATPSALTLSGTATKTYVSGPTPASVALLASGATTSFTWTYTITGSVGQTYAFSGYAIANGGTLTTSTATTNTGSIGDFSATVSPLSVVAGSTSVQVRFTVQNGLTSGTVDRVTITNPDTNIWQSDGTWGANDITGWTQTLLNNPTRYRFTSPAAGSDIPANNGTQTFTVTFTLIGNPGADTTYTFPVAIRRRGGGTTTLNVLVTVQVPKLQVTSIVVDSSVANGDTVTVVMEVKNIGSTTLTDVTPSALTTGGTATKVLSSGPTPASVASLASDASTTFEWVYTITGSVGQTYNFTGNATANGGSITATSVTSNTGSISSYGVSVNPSSVTAGSTNVQLAFTVTNNLTSGTLDRVRITNPNTSIWQSDGTWGNNDGSGWTKALLTGPTRYEFTSPAAGSDILANGGTKTFTVTFTLVADPGTDTDYTFAVAIRRRGAGTTTLNVTVAVTRYVLTVKSVTPASIDADGVSTSRVTVTLTRGGTGQSGQTITFTTNAGTFTAGGTSTTAVTDASGDAFVDLRSTASASDVTATVTASFLSSATTSTTVTFLGITYTLTPATATVDADGQSTVSLTLRFRYTSGGAITGASTTVSLSGSGALSPSGSVSSSASDITLTYTAPASSSDGTATITAAAYKGFSAQTSTISYRGITFTLTPATATVDADGQSTVALTLTFRYTTGGTAITGATATVSATSGSVSPASPASSASPIAVTYTAPAASADGSATVTAAYRGFTATSTITLRGITFTLTPTSATVDADGQSTVSLTLRLRYTSGGAITGATTTVSLSGSGALSPSGSVSSSASDITLTYTAPVSSSDGTATVTASAYRGFSALTSTISFRGVVLSLSASPTSIAADGVTTSTLTATLTAGGSGLSGRTINFSTTAGSLSAGTAVTNGSGQATVTLTSSASKTNVTATVTATYIASFTSTATVTFTGITINPMGYLAATAGNGQVTLYWENPTQYFTEAVVIRRAGSAPTADPVDGTTYSVGGVLADGSEVVYKGTAVTAVNAGLTNGTTYYYKAYTGYSSSSLYSTAQSINVTPTDGLAGRPTWSYALSGAGSFGIPLAKGSQLYSARGNRLAGLNVTDGTQAWLSASLGGSVQGWVVPWPKSGTWSDALGDWTTYTLYAGASDGKVYAYNPATGAKLWESAVLGDEIRATVAIQSWDLSDPTFQATYTDGAGGPMDVLFPVTKNASATNNKLYALRGFADQGGNPGGSILWTFNDGVPAGDSRSVDIITTLPWVTLGSANRIYMASYSNTQTQPSLWAINALDGNLQASQGTLAGTPSHLGDITADPAVSVDETTLYLGSASGYVIALNTSDLSLKWAFSTGSPIVGFIWEDWVNPGILYFSTQDGNVRAIQDNGTSAALLQITAAPVSGVSTPLVDAAARKLWVGGASGQVVEIDLDTWVTKSVTLGDGTETLGDPNTNSAGNTLYVGTSGGRIYALPLPLP